MACEGSEIPGFATLHPGYDGLVRAGGVRFS